MNIGRVGTHNLTHVGFRVSFLCYRLTLTQPATSRDQTVALAFWIGFSTWYNICASSIGDMGAHSFFFVKPDHYSQLRIMRLFYSRFWKTSNVTAIYFPLTIGWNWQYPKGGLGWTVREPRETRQKEMRNESLRFWAGEDNRQLRLSIRHASDRTADHDLWNLERRVTGCRVIWQPTKTRMLLPTLLGRDCNILTHG